MIKLLIYLNGLFFVEKVAFDRKNNRLLKNAQTIDNSQLQIHHSSLKN